ncbi:DUF5995 family protein [Longimicrobium sp.]|uniref:DUF5995 family protein n=1 Tax=Longimicrobium sp. TaxID=2029185 RepID=UPI002E2FA043|nr:DUF5995 family protein [Longimicrobium sp.]HEX6039122.1 DUF5995 family protein [Longimicrobium sp.]
MTIDTAALPATIDQVLVRLNGILDDALRQGTRIGYFAALYERVTTNVRRALVAGNVFQDNARMERLDVVFADRFLDAWDTFSAGGAPTRSWQAAFALLPDANPLAVQHLLVGMNAHINLDLGIAAATVAPTAAELQALWPDFKTINDVLSRLVKVVEDELGQISPRLRHIEDFAPGLEDRLFDFGIDVARDFAWDLARELVATPPAGWDAVIAERDALVAEMAAKLYPLHGLAGEVQRWIHNAESADVRYNIQVIAE